MNRRLFLTSLFATGATLAVSAEQHAAFSAESVQARLYEYSRNRGISRRRLRELNYYSQSGQTSRDVRRLLRSTPNHVGDGVEAYTLEDSVSYHQGIPLNAGAKLVVRYGRDGKTANWYVQ